MNHNSIRSLLKNADAESLQEIVEKSPSPFNTESLFQRSYAKYKGEEKPLTLSRPFYKHTAFHAMTAAACLLLTVGLSVGIWSRQQRIETLPPQETMAAVQTETRTETTAQVTESQATMPATEISQKMSETTIMQPETVIHSTSAQSTAKTAVQTAAQSAVSSGMQSETITQPLLTQPQVTTYSAQYQTMREAERPSVMYETTQRGAGTTVPETVTDWQTGLFPTQGSQNETSAQTTATPELSESTLSPQTTTIPMTTNSPWATNVTQAVTTVVFTTIASTDPTEPIATAFTTDPTEPVYDYELLPGFEVEIAGDYAEIHCLALQEPTPTEIQFYTLDSDRFVIESTSEAFLWKAPEGYCAIRDLQTGQRICMKQFCRNGLWAPGFRLSQGVPAQQNVNGCPGFWLGETLYWDAGDYLFQMYLPVDSTANPDFLLLAAECVRPSEKAEP